MGLIIGSNTPSGPPSRGGLRKASLKLAGVSSHLREQLRGRVQGGGWRDVYPHVADLALYVAKT